MYGRFVRNACSRPCVCTAPLPGHIRFVFFNVVTFFSWYRLLMDFPKCCALFPCMFFSSFISFLSFSFAFFVIVFFRSDFFLWLFCISIKRDNSHEQHTVGINFHWNAKKSGSFKHAKPPNRRTKKNTTRRIESKHVKTTNWFTIDNIINVEVIFFLHIINRLAWWYDFFLLCGVKKRFKIVKIFYCLVFIIVVFSLQLRMSIVKSHICGNHFFFVSFCSNGNEKYRFKQHRRLLNL